MRNCESTTPRRCDISPKRRTHSAVPLHGAHQMGGLSTRTHAHSMQTAEGRVRVGLLHVQCTLRIGRQTPQRYIQLCTHIRDGA